tara:strand:- start:3127 stop:3495 length:369 start_codon:yes stop_codon:yes gene_type:complete
VNEEEQKDLLFQQGLDHYKSNDYFEAHESWEDLWSDYYLEDRKFVQGLIQLAVSFVHLGRGNMNGAKSLLNKCSEKFKIYSGVHRGINVENLLDQINNVEKMYNQLADPKDFDWTYVPKLDS